MGVGATWWRRAAAVLATLALALVMFGPPAQATACPDELQVSAASADQVHAQTPAEPCGDGCCPCICCHTHSPAGFTPADVALAAPSEAAARHVLASGPPPTGNPPFGLKRPPRA